MESAPAPRRGVTITTGQPVPLAHAGVTDAPEATAPRHVPQPETPLGSTETSVPPLPSPDRVASIWDVPKCTDSPEQQQLVIVPELDELFDDALPASIPSLPSGFHART